MPGYRRFVTYLFQYENGRKGGNCGFAKVEVRQDKCRIELQIKGYQDKKMPVYLFARKKEKPEGAYLGELTIKNGIGNSIFLIAAEEIGDTPYGIDDMRGVYLQGEQEYFIASQWDDADTDWSAFVPYEAGMEEQISGETAAGEPTSDKRISGEIAVGEQSSGETAAGEPTSDKRIFGEAATGSANVNETQNADTGLEKMKMEKSGKKEDETELHVTQATQAVQPAQPDQAAIVQPFRHADAWEKQWQRFTAAHPIFCPFDEDEGVYGVKMNLRDFKILPKQYWGLANNSFLLHGYFNYRYVLFGYMDGEQKRWFIGIPGVFQNQEQILAGAFGFPEFRTKQLTRQKTGEFGYWYRYLDLSE